MELKGKKIAFLGDSITEGYGASGVDKTYWSILGQETGAEVFGYGIGGTTIAKRNVPLPEPNPNKYFGSRVDGMIEDADIIVIFGGTNDFGGSDPAFGKMEDRRLDTFYGGYHLLLQQLMERYPQGQIVALTPLHRLTEDEGLYNEQDGRRGGKLVEYVDAIIEVAGFYGVPVVDLFRTCPIQPRFEPQRQLLMPDGVHPNDAGHRIIARRLISAMKAL